MKGTPRSCPWAQSNALQQAYHDREWGVPVRDDRVFFEFLILEGAQAGLSWDTILRKRRNYRRAFARFDPQKVARFGQREIKSLLKNEGIVRNHLKITAAVRNAECFLEVQRAFGSFDQYIWQFVGGRPKQNRWLHPKQVPAVTPEAVAMSRDLRRRGFRFVGPTICYAFMQATGMVNDHLTVCFRHTEIKQRRGVAKTKRRKTR